ncbi:hypothetical protein GYH30_048202 [Glycine max]|nr:hypothetical protein GYH30_048202 [Glycine max]
MVPIYIPAIDSRLEEPFSFVVLSNFKQLYVVVLQEPKQQ